MTDAQYLKDIIAPNDGFLNSMLVYHYLSMAHLAGEALIIFGLLTRIAVAIQIPI